MAKEKFGQVYPRQMMEMRPQNNLPTIAVPFQVREEKNIEKIKY